MNDTLDGHSIFHQEVVMANVTKKSEGTVEMNAADVKRYNEWMSRIKQAGVRMKRSAVRRRLLIKKAQEAGITVSEEEIDEALKYTK